MTDDAAVEVVGGLDEPDDLQPDEGALRLAAREDADWSRADWERAAAGVLRKARRLSEDAPDDAVWAALTRTTYDGVAIPPLGTPAAHHAVRPVRTGPWDVRTENRGDHASAVEDLEHGGTSLWLRVDPDTDLAGALEGVRLDLAPVTLGATGHQLAAARAFADLLARHDGTPHPATNLGGDPLAGDGRDAVAVAGLARDLGVRGLVVDATTVHELGASDMQEVGYSLAVGVHALRLLTEHGYDADVAAGLVEFRYVATDEQFATIAKLRAARRCWARVLALSGVSTSSTGGTQRQHAVTSRPMMSAVDPWVNMLRGTVAAFAAGVGGAESVTVVPFDSPLGEPDAFGRRIARNVSALLVAESHVAAVADPAGGAYAVETLTDDMAAAAWAELQRIEASGGVLAALEDGSFRARVDEVAARRERDVATRVRPITGLSEFPNLGEAALSRVSSGSSADGRDVRRYGAAFEAFRAEPPSTHVFLATLGPVAQHTARAGFAINLLAAGGVAVDEAGATSGVEDLTAAYDGQAVVCLAGADTTYAEWGSDAAQALRAAGATRVLVAGKPAQWADDSCATGVDAVAFLARTREALR
jgi:methylmalonyl-CoA mutase